MLSDVDPRSLLSKVEGWQTSSPQRKKKCLLNTQGKSIGALGFVFKTVPTAQAGVGPLLHTSSTAGSQMLGYRHAQHVQSRDGSCAK